MTDQTITVYVADADAGRRSRVVAMIDAADGFTLVGEGETGEAGAEIDESVPTTVLVGAGSEGAVELVAQLRRDLPALAVAVIDPTDDFELLAAGARSTLSSATTDIGADVHRMLDDEPILPSDWAAELGMRLDGLDERIRRTLQISETEREVMTRTGAGDGATTIAADNDVSERLVRQHLGYSVAKYQLALEAQATLADIAASDD